MTLCDIENGARVRICAIRASDPAVQRLMLLGLVEGAEVEFLRASLGGDPLEIQLYGVGISLRRAQAQSFDVELLD
jgi:Fe2+ transport system protein FeoA